MLMLPDRHKWTLKSLLHHVRRAEDSDEWRELVTRFASAPASGRKFLDTKRRLSKAWQDATVAGLVDRPPLRILELGTSGAHFPLVCRYLGHDVVALDRPGAPEFEAVSAWLGEPVVAHAIRPCERLPELGARFDLVTAFRIAFHKMGRKRLFGVTEWAFFLDDLKDNVLRADGGLCMKFNEDHNPGAGESRDAAVMDLFAARGGQWKASYCLFNLPADPPPRRQPEQTRRKKKRSLLYSYKPARDIVEVSPRRPRANVMKGPLRAFLQISQDGRPTLYGGKLGKELGPWGTYSVASALCLYPSMILVTPKDEIIGETLSNLHTLRATWGFRKPNQEAFANLRNGGTLPASIEPTQRLEGSFFLLGSAPKGYYHWLIDYLPNIPIWRELPGKSKLLIPPLRHRWQHESLAYAGVKEEDTVKITGHLFISGELTFVDPVNVSESKISRSIVTFFSNLRDSGAAKQRRRLFVSRTLARARRLLNEDEVVARLQPLGFEKVEAETLSFGDQVRLFSGAEIVVGPHGAGLANSGFCSPGGILVELRAATFRQKGVSAFAALADLFDHRYGLVHGESADQQHPERRHADFRVAPDAVARIVESLLERGRA